MWIAVAKNSSICTESKAIGNGYTAGKCFVTFFWYEMEIRFSLANVIAVSFSTNISWCFYENVYTELECDIGTFYPVHWTHRDDIVSGCWFGECVTMSDAVMLKKTEMSTSWPCGYEEVHSSTIESLVMSTVKSKFYSQVGSSSLNGSGLCRKAFTSSKWF